MTNVPQRSFAGGEIAPSLYGRTDLAKYVTALRRCRNFIVQRHGGVSNRPGTFMVREVKNSLNTVRLLDFIFDEETAYILEMGVGYVRFIVDSGWVVATGAAAYNNATAYAQGALVTSGGVTYYAVQATTGHAPPDVVYWYPLPGDGTYEVPTPYGASDLLNLRVAQSADVMTLTHPDHPPRELRRLGASSWILVTLTDFNAGIAQPVMITAVGGVAGPFIYYAATAIAQGTFEESTIGSSVVSTPFTPSVANPITVTWNAVPSAKFYNLYKSLDGLTWGLIASAAGLTFDDTGFPPDYSSTPPEMRVPGLFTAPGDYPRAVAYYQQRRFFASSKNARETIWASRVGLYRNFTVSFPLNDDASLTFSLVGRRVGLVQHLFDLGTLIALSLNGEWMIEGDQAGILRPTDINARQSQYAGVGRLPPITVVDTALFVQSRGQIVRDLRKAVTPDQFESSDLTVMATHLTRGYQIVDWAYAQNPDSVVWVVRSDGMLMGLTYLREHDIVAWHRHDTDGLVENVCVIPEGDEDAVYLVVNRRGKRFIERMASRVITDAADERDLHFVDCGLSYDGRNFDELHHVTLSGGVSWGNDEQIMLTSSLAMFASGDVGNAITIKQTDGAELRLSIEEYVNSMQVKVRPDHLVPVDLRFTDTTAWAMAVDEVSGLSHLEGRAVSVLADGVVVSSPNNSDYPAMTVVGGKITLDTPYAVIHVGLPYVSDLETLDIDTPSGQSLKDRKISVTQVILNVEKSRGGFAGPPDGPTDDDPLNDLDEFKYRGDEDDEYGPIQLKTDSVEVNTTSSWDNHGRRFVRQVDPLPLTILTIIPQGYIG
jgi:hypothetical protein